VKLESAQRLAVIGESQPSQRHAEQHGPHLALCFRLTQLETLPRFFSKIQYVALDRRRMHHALLHSLRLLPAPPFIVGPTNLRRDQAKMWGKVVGFSPVQVA